MVKVNCILEQAMKAQRGSRDVTLLFFLNMSARLEWAVNTTLRPLYLGEGNPVPIVQEAEWTQGQSGRARKISPSPGIDPFRA